jgi:hypothetical protein
MSKEKFMAKSKKIAKDPSQIIKEFFSLEEIENIRKSDKFKYIGRNLLGVRKFDDWINNLEIGNVMHLNPLTT